MPVEFFLRREGDAPVTGFFRSLRSTPARVRRRALAQAHLVHDLALALERHVRLPELNLRRRTRSEYADVDIEALAERVRDDWDLGDGPVPHVVRQLERHGVVVARLAIDRSDVDGFSIWYPTRPVVVLGDDKGVASRSRFDAAHELGHLLMHEPERAGTRDAELEAHRFAAAFLLPAESIAPVLPLRADWRLLLDLKTEWGVSIAALLHRARSLDVMSEYHYVTAMKAMSARGWRRSEPGDELVGRPERPVLLERAVGRLTADGVSLGDVAAQAGLPVQWVRQLLGAAADDRPGIDI